MSDFEKSSYILSKWSSMSRSHSTLAVMWLLLGSSLHCREYLSRQFAYLDSVYNPMPQGNWPHLLTYYLLALNNEDCYMCGDSFRLVN